MKKIDSISNYLLAISAILFIAFYLCLSFYNRAASDDIVFISLAKGQTVFESVFEIFKTWSGRWTSCSYFFIVILASKDFEGINNFIFSYHFITLLILIYSTTTLLKLLIRKLFYVEVDYKTCLVFGILFIASFFYFTLDHIESWWWLSASFNYLQGIVFLLFGLALLLRENKNLLHYLLISLCFVYVGACFEIYILIVASLFFLIIFYYFKNKSIHTFQLNNNRYIKGFMVAFLSFCVAATICFSAPGNYNRRTNMFSIEEYESTEINTSTFIQKKYGIAIGLAFLWLVLGIKIKNASNRKISKSELKKIILIASIPLFISITVIVLFQFFVLKNIAIPMRGWTFTSFAMAIFFCMCFLCVGYAIQIKSFFMHSIIKIVAPLSIVIVLSLILMKQYNYTSKYANEYDKLIAQLIDAKKDKSTRVLFVKELPPSGMLTPLDIKDDYIKNPLKNILDLEFEIHLRNKLLY